MTGKRNPTAKPKPAKSRASKAQPRPKLSRRLKPKTIVWLSIGTLGLSLFAAGWFTGFFHRQIERVEMALMDGAADLGLKLQSIEVEGRQRTDNQSIFAALDVRQDQPILTFDPHEARERLLQLPWVREAEVERLLPDRIKVTLTERVPLAIWQLEGQLHVIDDLGQIIPNVKAEDFAGLPLVVGLGAAEPAADLLAMLELEPTLQPRIEAAVRVGERRWNLRLKGGLDIALPADDPASALARLVELDRAQGLLSRNLILIDLRQADRLVLRMAPGAAEPLPPQPPGEDT